MSGARSLTVTNWKRQSTEKDFPELSKKSYRIKIFKFAEISLKLLRESIRSNLLELSPLKVD